jgi:hypothetical protein
MARLFLLLLQYVRLFIFQETGHLVPLSPSDSFMMNGNDDDDVNGSDNKCLGGGRAELGGRRLSIALSVSGG